MTKFSRFQNTITDFTCTSFLCGSSGLGLQNSWVVIKCSFCELYPHSQYLWILKMDSSMSPWLCPFLVFYLATLFYCDCVSISTVLSARAWPQWLQKKKILVMIAQSVTWTQKHLHLQLRHGGFVWVFPKMMGDAIQKKRKRNCRSAGVGTEEVETGNKAIREDYFLLAADSLMISNLCIFLTVIWEYKMLLHSCI